MCFIVPLNLYVHIDMLFGRVRGILGGFYRGVESCLPVVEQLAGLYDFLVTILSDLIDDPPSF